MMGEDDVDEIAEILGSELRDSATAAFLEPTAASIANDLARGRIASAVRRLLLAGLSTGDEKTAAYISEVTSDTVLTEVPKLRREIQELTSALRVLEERRQEELIENLKWLLESDRVAPDEICESVGFAEAVRQSIENAARVTHPPTIRALARLTSLYRTQPLTRFFRNCSTMLIDLVPGEFEELSRIISHIDFDSCSQSSSDIELSRMRDENRQWGSQVTWQWGGISDQTSSEVRASLSSFNPPSEDLLDAITRSGVGFRGGVSPQERGVLVWLDIRRARALAYVVLEDGNQMPKSSRPTSI